VAKAGVCVSVLTPAISSFGHPPFTLKMEKIFVQNNQLDASDIQNLFCHKTLHVSGIFCAHHQELSNVRTATGTFHAGYVTTS